MTGGIGNPDWQRRYATSAAPLLGLNYPDNINSISAISDSNGFEYLILTINMGASTVYAHVKVDWYQDASGAVFMGTTDFTVPPGSFVAQKVPTMTRFYKVEIGNVGGATGHTINLAVYGTNADQENLLTQNTAVPQFQFNGNIGAGIVQTNLISGIFGGRVCVAINDETNNKWVAFMEYYDWTTQAWTLFWVARGADVGQSATIYPNLPYAPIRFNMDNIDVAIHAFDYSVIAP